MNRKIIFSVIFALLLSACMESSFAQTRGKSAASPGLELVSGIVPPMLKLGSSVPEQVKCVRVVQIIDPQVACAEHRCTRKVIFPDERAIRKGTRAFQIDECRTGPDWKNTDILSDQSPTVEASVFLLFMSIKSRSKLWEQTQEDNQFSIELPTQATIAKLSFKGNQYVWEEYEE